MGGSLREYNLKYFGLIDNVFHVKDIEAAIEKGKIEKWSNVCNEDKYFPKSRSGLVRSTNLYRIRSHSSDLAFGVILW